MYISNSLFTSNLGILGEADMMIGQIGGLEIFNTTFTLFNALSPVYGRSITINTKNPLKFETNFNHVTIECSSTIFGKGNYFEYLNNQEVLLKNTSPVFVESGAVSTKNCTFSNWYSSKGGVIYLNTNSIFSDTSSIFKNDAATEGGAIYINQAIANFSRTTFEYNYSHKGGAISGTSKSSISTFDLVSWVNNYAKTNAGCIYLSGDSTINITQSSFISNFAHENSAIFFIACSKSYISYSNFENNTALSMSTVYLLSTSTEMNTVTFKDNFSASRSTGIVINLSAVNLSNSIFKNTKYPNEPSSLQVESYSTNLAGCFISITDGSYIKINNSSFTNGYSVKGGAVYITGDSTIDIFNVLFQNWYAKYSGGAIYATEFLQLSIVNSKFLSNIWEVSGNDVYVDNGKTIIKDSDFRLNTDITSIYTVGCDFTAENIMMENLSIGINKYARIVYGGAIYAYNSEKFSVNHSQFKNFNYAVNGGAIYIVVVSFTRTSIPSTPIYSISYCDFINNSAFNGGAIYFDYVSYALVSKSTFVNNSATSSNTNYGYGGAINYSSSGNFGVNYFI